MYFLDRGVMKLVKTWIIVIFISDLIYYLGRFEHSHLICFVGATGFAAGITCEILILIIQLIKMFHR